MNLCRCENGHFYDKEKYPTCPHCSGGSAIDGKPTEAWDDGPTVPMNENRRFSRMCSRLKAVLIQIRSRQQAVLIQIRSRQQAVLIQIRSHFRR